MDCMSLRCRLRLALACLTALGIAGTASGCALPRAPERGSREALRGPFDGDLTIPGFDKRAWSLHLPPSYDGSTPLPVVLVLHGGGGKKEGARRMTCPRGDTADPACITALADREGFAVVFPDGNPGELFEELRTWNAGGGKDGFQCVSGKACEDGADDLAFFDALHAEIRRALVVDEARVFVAGHSNGAAMAHRLACERSTRFAAVAAVAGGNQLAAVDACTIARPVPVLQIHGSDDPCWTFEPSNEACAQKDGLLKVGIRETVDGWAERNGCSADPITEALPDSVDDGTTTTRETHAGCVGGGDVVLLLSSGAGHTWPGGTPALGESRVGPVALDFDADEEIWAFFKAHPLPADS